MEYLKRTWCGYALLLFGSCIVLFLSVIPSSAQAVSLKEQSVISDNVIKLGDIFEGLGRSSERVLGVAPRPGHEMTLNARTLLRIAMAMDLPWRPTSAADYVVLSRSASIVGRDMIEESLKEALAQKGVSGNYNLLFSGGDNQIILPANQPETLEVLTLEFKPQSNKFEAMIVAPSKDNPIQRLYVSGVLERMVDVPVLKNTLRNGTIIGRHDIDYLSIRERNLKGNIIVDAQELIGMTPRRVLIAGKSVKVNDVDTPKIVSRGDMVTMTFRESGLNLTARGKALEHGAKGDVIRVVNTGSNKTVEATVTASREVTVNHF